MIPESADALYFFILLVAPGFLWNIRAERNTPGEKRTALGESAQIVVASLLSTAPNAAFFYYWLWLVGVDANEVSNSTRSIIISGMACLTAWSAAIVRWPKAGAIRPSPILFQGIVEWRGAGEITALFVTLKNGTSWRGQYAGHDTGHDATSPWLVLKSPVSRRGPNRDKWQRFNEPQGVALQISEIESIRLVHLKEPSTP